MIVIGLTGGIGMGKSTLAKQLALLGAKICHADAIVHRLLDSGGAAVSAVARAFPGTEKGGAIDRKKLGDIVFNDEKKRKKLEALLHPLVFAEEDRFIEKQRALGAKYVVLDIPLLFETGSEVRCDIVIVASAPSFVQRQRVLARHHMTGERFASILRQQMSDRDKCLLADFVVQTGQGKAYSMRQLKQIMALLLNGGEEPHA